VCANTLTPLTGMMKVPITTAKDGNYMRNETEFLTDNVSRALW